MVCRKYAIFNRTPGWVHQAMYMAGAVDISSTP